MKKAKSILALVLVVALALSTGAFAAASDSVFTDVPADVWYAQAVAYCYENEPMVGTSDTAFSPNTELNRAREQLITILWHYDGSKTATAVPAFSDVQSASTWSADAIAWATEHSIATITPAVLQNERNPFFQQGKLQAHIRPYGTVMMDWFPLGGRSDRQVSLFEHETILEIAEAHNKSAAQVILRWHLQSGGIAIPGSRNPDHILENISIFDFELTQEEMRQIATLETGIPAFDFSTADSEPEFESFEPPADTND